MIKAKTDVTKRLLKSGIDRESLCEVLLHHFSRSSGSSEELSFGDQDNPTIIIRWNQVGEVKKIIVGHDISDADFSLLESAIDEVLVPTKIEYRRFPIFSARPVAGAIGFEDWFQIVPAPNSVPQPKTGWGDYVAILEVAATGSSMPMLVGRRAYREAQRVELILSALTVGGFRLQSQISQSAWVLDPDLGSQPRHMQCGYSSNGVYGTIEGFSDISQIPDVELVSINGYFDGRSQGSSENAILPDTFPFLSMKFRALDELRQQKFLRAARWLKHKDEVWNLSRSAAFVAAISAIEALLPTPAILTPPCAECGLTKSAGLTQQFAEFVDHMVGGAVPRKQRLALYGRRSRIVHGDLIAKNEDIFSDDVDPTRLREDGEQRWLNAISRIVLHNWLIDQRV